MTSFNRNTDFVLSKFSWKNNYFAQDTQLLSLSPSPSVFPPPWWQLIISPLRFSLTQLQQDYLQLFFMTRLPLSPVPLIRPIAKHCQIQALFTEPLTVTTMGHHFKNISHSHHIHSVANNGNLVCILSRCNMSCLVARSGFMKLSLYILTRTTQWDLALLAPSVFCFFV